MNLVNSFLWPFNIHCENTAFSYNDKQNSHPDSLQRIDLYLLHFVLLWDGRCTVSKMLGFHSKYFICTAGTIKTFFWEKKLVTELYNRNSHLKHFPSYSTTSVLDQPLLLCLFSGFHIVHECYFWIF